jgi:hypothetical protein
MAVTINSSPQLYTPSDNPIVWKFSSNLTATANFSYLVELYVSGSLTGTHQIYPESGIYSHFDASDVVKTMLDIPDINQSTFVADALNNREVYIIVKEFYGTTPTVHATATSSTINVWKARLDNKEFSNYDYTDWNGIKFFTDMPNDIQVREGNNYLVTIMTNYNVNIYAKLYNSSGTLLDTITTTANNKVTQINLNTDILASAFTSSTAYIEYYVTDVATGLVVSEVKRFYINRACQNGYPLYWINKYGSFDTYDFSFNAIFSSTIESKTFEKQFGEWSSSNYVFDASNSGVLSYFKTANDTLQLVSNYINQATQNWLVRTCYISSVVYMLDTTYDRVTIDNTAYTESQDRFVEEYTEIVTIKLPNTRKSIVV